MKKICILALGLAVVAFAYANAEKSSLDRELAAALKEYIYSRGVNAGLDGSDDDTAGADDDDLGSLAAALDEAMDEGDLDDDENNDNSDGNSGDDERRALLTALKKLELDTRQSDDGLTAEEEALVNDLAQLDEETINDLLENRELLAQDDQISSRSVKAQVAEDLLISRLMNDHPDLRALAYDDDSVDVEEGAVLDRRGWFKKAWKKVKKFFKKVGNTLKKLWDKWKKKVTDWLVKKGRALACRFCSKPSPISGMSRTVFTIIKNMIKSAACAICRAG